MSGPGVSRVPSRGRQGRLDGFPAADLFHRPLVGQHVAVLQQVPEPYRHRIQVQLPGQHVQERLHGEDRLRLSRRLHVAAGDAVGVNVVGPDGVVGDAVGVGDVAAVDLRRLEARIGAAVEVDVGVQGHQGPVPFGPQLEPHQRGVPGVPGHEFLGIVHHHLHRAAGGLGQVVADRHVHLGALAAEIAAQGDAVDVDALFNEVQLRGQHFLEPERRLARRPDIDARGIVGRHHRGVGLEVNLVDLRRAEGMLDDDVRVREALLHVAGGVLLERQDVGLAVRARGHAGIAVELRVNHRCSRRQRLRDIGHGGQFLVLHLDERQRLLGGIHRFGGHRGNLVPDETHLVPGQHRQVPKTDPHLHIRHVRARQHRVDSRHLARPRRVHAHQRGVRQRAAQALSPKRLRYLHVSRVFHLARDFVRPLHASNRLPYDLEIHGCSC